MSHRHRGRAGRIWKTTAPAHDAATSPRPSDAKSRPPTHTAAVDLFQLQDTRATVVLPDKLAHQRQRLALSDGERHTVGGVRHAKPSTALS
jgi:hypothetical protein